MGVNNIQPSSNGGKIQGEIDDPKVFDQFKGALLQKLDDLMKNAKAGAEARLKAQEFRSQTPHGQ